MLLRLRWLLRLISSSGQMRRARPLLCVGELLLLLLENQRRLLLLQNQLQLLGRVSGGAGDSRAALRGVVQRLLPDCLWERHGAILRAVLLHQLLLLLLLLQCELLLLLLLLEECEVLLTELRWLLLLRNTKCVRQGDALQWLQRLLLLREESERSGLGEGTRAASVGRLLWLLLL